MHLVRTTLKTASFIGLLCLAASLRGQTLYYAGSFPGSNQWSTTHARWTSASDGSGTPVVWTNGLDAIFSATGHNGTPITLSGDISVGTLTFSTTSFSISGGTSLTATTVASTVASATIATPMTLAAGGTSFGGTGNVTVSGIISGGDSLSKSGSGTLTLSNAANTYSGGTTISAGAINVTGNLSSSGGLTVDGGTVTFSNSAQVSSLSGSGGTISFSSPTGKTLTISGTSNYGGAITAAGATLAKSGGGTLTLSGGAGSIALGAGTVSVTAVGTLELSPSANAPFSGTATTLSLDSGTLTLGNSFSQTFGGLTLGSGTNTINFNSTANSVLTFSTGGVLGGTGNLIVSGYNYDDGARLVIPNLSDEARGRITINTFAAAWATTASDGTLVAIPEPSTYAAMAGVVALGAVVYRRRRVATAITVKESS